MNIDCPVCRSKTASETYCIVDGFVYYQCAACESLFIGPDVIAAMDRGEQVRGYDHEYWQSELTDARQRSRSDGLARAGEAILYARREVRRFLDVGAGPGYLLDELTRLLPAHAARFHGVEMFPPQEHSTHPNYRIGSAAELTGPFDAGVCVEVIEHLTPGMLTELIRGLASISAPDSLWLFNTGMPDYVKNEDPGYLDPRQRGHIISYGLKGLQSLFEPHGFRLSALPGKSFAFIAEFRPTVTISNFSERFYHPVPENKQLLSGCGLLYIAAFESARSYYFQEQSSQRAEWALSLGTELQRAKV